MNAFLLFHPDALTYLLQHLPVLGRIVGFFLITPPLSSKLAPRAVKVGLALIFWLGSDLPTVPANSFIPVVFISELLVGLSIGFLILILFLAFDVVGELLSNGMGLSFPGSFAPLASTSAGPVSGLIQIAAVSLFISLNGLEGLLRYFLHSFELFPLGSLPSLASMSNILSLFTQVMLLALSQSAILWVSLLLANALLLIASRLSGGLNLMSSGLPLLLFIGLCLLSIALIPVLRHLWDSLNALITPLFF